MLCAHKVDLAKDQWKVRSEEYTQFAENNSFKIYEASAFDGTNVNEMFIELSKLILASQREELSSVSVDRTESIVLFRESVKPKKPSGCC